MLRHRITFEQLQKIADGAGGTQNQWVEFVQAWADIKPVNSRSVNSEFFANGKINTRNLHEVIIRYRDDIDQQMRINFDGEYFDILQIVNVDQQNKWVRFLVVSQ